MEYELRVDEEKRLVIVVVRGSLEAAAAQRVMEAARGATRSGAFDILYDMRDAKPDGLTHGDVFWLARIAPKVPGSSPWTRVATLYPTEFRGRALFWEDVFRNAGINARAFEEEADARAWLSEGQPRRPPPV